MIQVVDGVVTIDGETLTGQQLRDRLGADADLVLQVSYLNPQQQRDACRRVACATVSCRVLHRRRTNRSNAPRSFEAIVCGSAAT